MSAGDVLRATTRQLFDDLRELDKVAPDDVEAIVAGIVAHLRSWRPESVSPLGTLPPRGEVRDPRGAP